MVSVRRSTDTPTDATRLLIVRLALFDAQLPLIRRRSPPIAILMPSFASISSPATADSGSMHSTPDSSLPPAERDDAVSKAMLDEEEKMARIRERGEAKHDERMAKERRKDVSAGKDAMDTKFKALEYLLNQSKLYSTIMLSQMQRQEDEEQMRDEKDRKRALKREETAEKAADELQWRATLGNSGKSEDDTNGKALPTKGRGQTRKSGGGNKISSYFKKEDLEAKAGKASISEALDEAVESEVKASDVGFQSLHSARQPSLVSGGTMRQYQLEGLEWLTSLYENGLNGILADEMGLGKTIQTISFLAFLREKGTFGPFLIAAPLSTTSNWVEEFRKWTPKIPVVLYHGSKAERESIRSKRLKKPGSEDFPVVVTSYEICMNDRKFLAGFGWKFIIIDEGHRIKNLNCRLIRELQSYQSANRLLITGTPLQNNLTELWSLLHFLMPAIFDKLEAFESWFDFSALKDRDGYEQILSEERQKRLVDSLHAILKPFLLRRIKADVEKLMPKKREYVLFAPLTPMQRELYQAILDGTSRSYLEDKAVTHLSATTTPQSTTRSTGLKRKALDTLIHSDTPMKSAKTSRASTPATNGSGRGRRAAKRLRYEELSDTKYFQQLQDEGDSDAEPEPLDSEGEEQQIRAKTLALAKRQIGSKKLQNPVMQLRLCCDSPYNFFNPFALSAAAADDDDAHEVADETLVTSSGKMMLLDALLPKLFSDGHKVLIFSQFKTQLDLLETYATELRGWNVCRIDGSVPQAERQAQIKAFNEPALTTSPSKAGRGKKSEASGPDSAKPSNLFLLSTRAGGQGINLVAADTVILFDSDWNPQQDLQAQDRAHRIGQTRNVLVYRFATRNTIEQTLLESAEGKRRLEKLVIRKGGVIRGGKKDREERDGFDELQKLLRRSDGEKWDVDQGGSHGILTDRDLQILTDRSDEAYERAQKGLDGEGDAFKAVEIVGEGSLLEGLKP